MTKTIVLMTICDLAKDSRTYKQALSLSQGGYHCIVLQGEKGALDPATLPFELRTIGRPSTGKKDKPQRASSTECAKPPTKKKKSRLKDSLPDWARCAIPYSRFLYRQLRYQLSISNQIPQADLYYLHYFDLFPAVHALAKRQGAKIIYDAHDFHSGLKPVETLSRLELKYIKPWQKRMESHCIEASSAVVTVCEGLAAIMNETFGCSTQVIRNCHDARLDNFHGLTLRQKLGLNSTDRLLVTIGNAKNCMAFQQIFEALRQLPEHIHLAFVGNDYHLYLQGEDYQAIRHRVHNPGAVKPYEIVPFVQDADAALILYYPHSVNSYHCLPNGFFQSIAAGLPLLYPELPEISRIAVPYQLGLPIDPLKPESMQRAIAQLFNEPDQLENYRENTRLANQNLSWQQEELHFKQIIETSLA